VQRCFGLSVEQQIGVVLLCRGTETDVVSFKFCKSDINGKLRVAYER